jgi:DNA-directed RNA polymerase specialized sigma24 family protein
MVAEPGAAAHAGGSGAQWRPGGEAQVSGEPGTTTNPVGHWPASFAERVAAPTLQFSTQTLPTPQVFFMVHVDGWDQTEAARMLGHSKGYVSKLLKRAEERLTAAGWKVEHHAE